MRIYKENLGCEFQTLELVVLPVEVGGMDRDLVGQGECLGRAFACLESHHGESLLKLTVAADKNQWGPPLSLFQVTAKCSVSSEITSFTSNHQNWIR